MPLVQGGPPEWVWERPAGPLRWELVPSVAADGPPQYELRLTCGLEIVRLHYFTRDEIEQLESLTGGGPPAAKPADAVRDRQAAPESGQPAAGTASDVNPGNRSNTFRPDLSPQPQGGGFSDPDF